MSTVLQADGGSEASKSSSWHSKRRRSPTPDEGWDRRDRKRGHYEDDGETDSAIPC